MEEAAILIVISFFFISFFLLSFFLLSFFLFIFFIFFILFILFIVKEKSNVEARTGEDLGGGRLHVRDG